MKMSKNENKLRIEFSHGIEETVLNTNITLMQLSLLLYKKGIITISEHTEIVNSAFPKESIIETQKRKLKKFMELAKKS